MLADLTALLSSLVAIDSVNPSLVAGGAGETRIADFIEGDRLYGRGAYDMKAGVAAALFVAREASRLDLAGDVVVAAVADEEHASLGVQEALRRIQADAAVVTEPTQLELVVAHKGFVWSEIEVAGRSAHGSQPDLGIDAIVKTGAVLQELERLDRALADRRHHASGAARCTPRRSPVAPSCPATRRSARSGSSAARCPVRPPSRSSTNSTRCWTAAGRRIPGSWQPTGRCWLASRSR
jgi:acetylornithine deacetylase/succinyl-diaminopimelate desuccinylase-like protein